MKHFKTSLFTAALVACFATTTQAQEEENQYQLKTGNLTMTIDISKGGKILSLKHNDTEVISQSRFPESFGSTFWTSPQKEWNWPPVPEYDKNPYTVVEKSDKKLVIKSQVSERLKYQIGKEFTTDKKTGAIVVTYSIKNEADETRQVAPWEITRVPNNDGLIFFDAPLDGITPAGLMTFTAEHGAVWYKTDEAPQNRKINADGKGWLAYANNGLLLVKQFEDLKAEAPAPGEAEIQVYVNRGKSYIELESQGAYTTLAPGQELKWTVRWYLLPVNGDAQPSESLKKAVSSVVKK
jgi:hypothetical protein